MDPFQHGRLLRRRQWLANSHVGVPEGLLMDLPPAIARFARVANRLASIGHFDVNDHPATDDRFVSRVSGVSRVRLSHDPSGIRSPR